MMSRIRFLARFGVLSVRGLCFLALVSSGCAWLGSNARPGWIDDADATYPPAQYLLGVGQAGERSGAADQAYAAVARIFKAEVSAQAKDWESYLVVESRGATSAERRLTLDSVTKVSTDKALENVRIMETWYDANKGVHYALAVMSRPQAEASVMERVAALDRSVEADVDESRQTSDKLTKIRDLRRAVKNLVLREAYNADLRVIRSSGQGTMAPYQVNALSNELAQFLAGNLLVAIQVSGDQSEPIERALAEGLLREGLNVVNDTAGGERRPSELLVRGTARFFPIEVRDPNFKYVRWCSDFDVVEVASSRVVGAIARSGKEGHLTEREATAKALRIMRHELSTDVAKAIASHIFGETALPASAAMPGGGCPRD